MPEQLNIIYFQMVTSIASAKNIASKAIPQSVLFLQHQFDGVEVSLFRKEFVSVLVVLKRSATCRLIKQEKICISLFVRCNG